LLLDNVRAGAADLIALPFRDASIESLSCMHVVEHVGLGRYGDPLDPDGDLKAMAELQRVLAPGGALMFVVPVGSPRVVFNAHRVYSFEGIRSVFHELQLEEFALVPDREEGLLRHADPALVERQRYGCGCFWLRRPT
jgi:SAM-dependent methyltransferase